MKIEFYKYQGAGNDFVIIDNRAKEVQLSVSQINFLCDRRFGIGADGLMLLEQEEGYDFKMVYYNADGNESTMCGNGGRCIVAFAQNLGVAHQNQHFVAIDGAHLAQITGTDIVSLQMKNVDSIEFLDDATILDTGSPHYVKFVKDINAVDVFTEGKAIRNLERFQPKGINVNFAQWDGDVLKVRTYERGVEDETLACGTGVTASAIASACDKTGTLQIDVEALGGQLNVKFDKLNPQQFENVWLTGPAKMVYKGIINL